MFMSDPLKKIYASAKLKLLTILSVMLALIGVSAAASTYANPIVSIVDHGNVDAAPYSGKGAITYGVYRNALYYTSRGKFYRLDSPKGVPQELPSPAGITQAYASKFIVFDDALFVLLNRRLYRLEASARQWKQIDIPQSIFNVPTEVQIPDVYELAVYDDQLFFFVSEYFLNCEYSGSRHQSLYRLQAANAVVDKVWLDRSIGCTSFLGLKPTLDGLIYVESVSGNRYGTTEPRDNIHRIVTPLSDSNPPDPEVSYLLTDSLDLYTDWSDEPAVRDRKDRSIAWLPGSLFYRGRQAEPSSPNAPSVGPFPHPGNPHAPNYRESNEPYRVDIASGNAMYFDLRQTFDQTGDFPWDRVIGSSNPGYFVTANKTVYFRASTVEGEPELYRISPSTQLPELISLNPNAPSMAIPLGQYDNRLWLLADSGAGLDLHFLQQDGLGAVPLVAGETIATTARSFIEFQGKVIFSAVDNDRHLKTWVADVDREEVVDTTSLRTTIYVDGKTQSSQPRLVRKYKSKINIRCNTANKSGSEIARIRTTILQQDKMKNRNRTRQLKTCRGHSLANDEAVNCTVKTRIRSKKRVRFVCSTRAVTTSGKKLFSRKSVTVVVRR